MSNFVKKTIGQLVRETAECYPQNPELGCPDFGIRQTYSEFYQSCRDVAKCLIALGIKRGDNVAVWTTNIPDWIHLQFALGMTGGILVTVNTNYQTHELEYILKQSDSTTLFLMESYREVNFYENVRKILPELDHHQPGTPVSAQLPALKNIIYIGKRESTPGMLHYSDIITMGREVTDKQLEIGSTASMMTMSSICSTPRAQPDSPRVSC
jgi:fatty-acyl-CoA synthase